MVLASQQRLLVTATSDTQRDLAATPSEGFTRQRRSRSEWRTRRSRARGLQRPVRHIAARRSWVCSRGSRIQHRAWLKLPLRTSRSMRCTVSVVIASHLPSMCTATAHVIAHHRGDETRRAAGLTAAWTLAHATLSRQRITPDHVGACSVNELAPCRRTALGSLVSRAAYFETARTNRHRHPHLPPARLIDLVVPSRNAVLVGLTLVSAEARAPV